MLYDTSRLYHEVSGDCLHCGYNPDESDRNHTNDCPVGVVEGLHLHVTMKRVRKERFSGEFTGDNRWEEVSLGAFRNADAAKRGITEWLGENSRNINTTPQPNYRRPLYEKIMLVGRADHPLVRDLFEYTVKVGDDLERAYEKSVQELGRKAKVDRCLADLEDLRSREEELRPEFFAKRLAALETELVELEAKAPKIKGG